MNGYICKKIPNFDNEVCNFDLNTMEWTPLEDIDVIESVVTKEQFASMQYNVEVEQ